MPHRVVQLAPPSVGALMSSNGMSSVRYKDKSEGCLFGFLVGVEQCLSSCEEPFGSRSDAPWASECLLKFVNLALSGIGSKGMAGKDSVCVC